MHSETDLPPTCPFARWPMVVPITVHWNELDTFQHVNHARYLTWFETARMLYFERVALATGGAPAVGPILAHVECDYLRPVLWPVRVLAATRVRRIGNTSFTMDFACARAEKPEALVARGLGVLVLIDYASGRKVAMPDDLRARIYALQPNDEWR